MSIFDFKKIKKYSSSEYLFLKKHVKFLSLSLALFENHFTIYNLVGIYLFLC